MPRSVPGLWVEDPGERWAHFALPCREWNYSPNPSVWSQWIRALVIMQCDLGSLSLDDICKPCVYIRAYSSSRWGLSMQYCQTPSCQWPLIEELIQKAITNDLEPLLLGEIWGVFRVLQGWHIHMLCFMGPWGSCGEEGGWRALSPLRHETLCSLQR